MPSDPEIDTLIARVQRAARPPLSSMTPDAARQAFRQASRVLDIAPAPLARIEDRSFSARDGATIPVRLYANATGTLPVLLFFHGGGFTIGGIDTHDAVCRRVARDASCLVVSVDYRLSPEHRFPTAPNDAHDALLWLHREGAALGADVARMAVAGDSAGGTLSALVAIHARDAGIPLARQLLIYPGTAKTKDSASAKAHADGVFLDATLLAWFLDQYAPDPAMRGDWRFAPLDGRGPDGGLVDLAGTAPAWVLVAGLDPLHDEGLAYAERLRAAGVDVVVRDDPDMVHGYLQFAGAITGAKAALACFVDEVAASFRA